MSPSDTGEITVALAGPPNVGKSTVFNLLTGLHQHVGNWTGKTVERKEGTFQFGRTSFRVIDLPGTYSLTAASPEELVAREFIIRERPDMVVAVLNAALLEHGLYLVAELLSLRVPVIIGLNMMDVARNEGLAIEPEVLSAALGLPVIPMEASSKGGIKDLVKAIAEVAEGVRVQEPHRPEIREDHRSVLDRTEGLIEDLDLGPYPHDWAALKLLEGDEEISRITAAAAPADRWEEILRLLKKHEDALVAVASGRYAWVERMVRAALVRPQAGPISLTHRIDRWLTHPAWGLLAFAAVMSAVFFLTYAIGIPLQGFLEKAVIQNLQGLVGGWTSAGPWWVQGALVEGFLGGLGTLLTFVPILVLFFGLTAILEDVGYLARAAFIMDRFMHAMHLHGKSCLPLIIGFGCNVPGVLGTRIIESTRARLLTMFLVPLVPCTGRMAVIAFLAPLFFGERAPLVTVGLILLALGLLFATGLIGGRLFFRQDDSPFIMELPLYHIPNLRTIRRIVQRQSLEFLRKAFFVILPVSLIVWALSRFPGGEAGSSYLAGFSRALEPAGALMGFDWRLIVALLAGFIAKENALAVLAVLFGAGEGAALGDLIASAYPPATGLAFMASQLLFIPCAATVAAFKQESRSWRLTIYNMLYLFLLSAAVSIAVYQVARRI
ncbi:MAG: ferrous iron transport protein B [Candidatus Aminicenantes bacterium]|nr:ferrous iron transport protein B [Candidatus Aminicenantes bacterium]